MKLTRIKLIGCLVSVCFSVSLPALAVSTSYQNSSDNSTNDNEMVGPFQFNAIYSSAFGSIFGAHWTNYLTPDNAFGFGLDFGDNEFRLDGTFAHSINTNQRFKLTAEHYAQQFTFDFISGQKVQWAGQNDFGGVYQYLLTQNTWFKSISAGAYYTSAETETINSNAVFYPPQGGTFYATQRFVGADNTVGYIGTSMQPWDGARIEADLNYDNASYDTLYVRPWNSSGPGGTLGLEQVLTGHFKMEGSASHFAPYNFYKLGAAYLFNTRPGTRLELKLDGSRVSGNLINGADDRGILALAYSWDGDPCGPRANYYNDDPDNFITWTSVPAIYMPAVLVQKDERVFR